MIDAFLRGLERGLDKHAAEFDLAPGEKPMASPSWKTPGLSVKQRLAQAKGDLGFRARQEIASAKMAVPKAVKAVKRAAKPYVGAAGTAYKALKWGIPLTAGAAGLSALSAMTGSSKD